jgi:signal transduction histidine kinase/dihydroneopterin aldolase
LLIYLGMKPVEMIRPNIRLPTGLRGRLLLAFGGISSFAILAAVAGLLAFVSSRQALEDTTGRRVPETVGAMELLRHTERLVATGPALLNTASADEISAITAAKNAELEAIRRELGALQSVDGRTPPLMEIDATIESLTTNLDEISIAMMRRNAAASDEKALLRNAFEASRQFAKAWSSQFDALQKQVVDLQRESVAPGANTADKLGAIDSLGQMTLAMLPLNQLQRRAADSFQILVGATETEDLHELARLEANAEAAMRDIDGLVSGVDLETSTALLPAIELLHRSALGPGGLFAVRKAELEASGDSRRLIAENTSLSNRLSDAVRALVSISKRQMDTAAQRAFAAQRAGSIALAGIVVLSLLSSVLIVWLYVGRNIVSRLTHLSATMAAIAGGRRDIAVNHEGVDEIAAMGRSVEVFRQNAIERDTLLAERAEAAEQLERQVAERTAELRDALDQQLATAEVLQVINNSPGNMTPVFETVLEKAAQLCDIDSGILWVYDGTRFHPAALHAVPPAYRDYIENPAEEAPVFADLQRGKDVVHVPDLVSSYAENKLRRAVIDLRRSRTGLNIAIRKKEELLGVIAVGREQVRPFSEAQIARLRGLAAQAAIAIENARLLADLRRRTNDLQESLAYQTATAEVLRIVTSSPDDLKPVFEAILDRITELCSADAGNLWLYDAGTFTPAAVRNPNPEAVALLLENPFRPGPLTALCQAAQTKAPVHVPDITADDAYRAGDPFRIWTLERVGARSLLAVPLLKQGEMIGALVTYRSVWQPFTDNQIALVQTFADQAVIAIENAHLFSDLRQRTEDLQQSLAYQTATAEVLQVINSSPGDLAPVFDAMLEKAMRLCDAAFGTLRRYDGEHLDTVAFRGVPAAYAEFLRTNRYFRPTGTGLVELVHGDPVVHQIDVASEPGYESPARRALVELGGARTMIAVALRKEGTLLGSITLYRQEVRPFTQKQIALVQSFAAQAVIAMENARLLDEIRQRQAELRVTFDNMAHGVVMFDSELRLAAWNRQFQEMLDLPEAFLAEPRTYADFIRYLAARGEFGAGADPEAELQRYIANAARHYSFERTRPDGTVLEIRHNPMPEGGFVLIYSDITERKRSEAEIRAARDAAEEASRTIAAAYQELKTAQARLIQAEKMASLGQLTAGIAHEIKNPLNFVNNFANLSVELLHELKETAAPALAALDDDKRADADELVEMLTGNLEKIAEHGQRADGIVKSMLEHSRGSSGDRREVDLNELVEEALNLAYHGARAQDQDFNITLERDFDHNLGPIEIVPQDLTRVFLNLFGNGFYAANKRQKDAKNPNYRPTLTVTTRDIGGEVEIRVRDNGSGIPPEHRNKLFQPFFTTKPTGEGTGLGLSISYDIVTQQHGGTIEVASELGAFTEFTVRLPRVRHVMTTEAAA